MKSVKTTIEKIANTVYYHPIFVTEYMVNMERKHAVTIVSMVKTETCVPYKNLLKYSP